MELYCFQAEVNGTGFPLAYLLLENNGRCGEGIRTSVIQAFLTKLREEEIQPEFLLTDKDFAQINAARFTWCDIKIQLCKWHIKRAVMSRLASNKNTRSSTFNPLSEFGIRFPFEGVVPSPKFCPKEHRETICKMMEKHLHQHPLIPMCNGQFITRELIQEAAIQEIYTFCKENSLVSLWCYLWTEWYSDQRWLLWARSACENKLSILKTTMFIEGHWKVIKRDFLYKFFRPRLDLVVYIIISKVMTHQVRKLQQILTGREKPEWIKQFKSEWKMLSTRTINEAYVTNVDMWICGCLYYLTSRFGICKHLVQQKGSVTSEFFDHIKRNHQPPFLTECDQNPTEVQLESIILHNDVIHSDNQDENSNEIYDELISLTTKTLKLLEEQKAAGNTQWIKGIKKNFDPISKMIEEVEKYGRKRTLPLTWKGHTHNTRFLN
jgi:hypothetical protein